MKKQITLLIILSLASFQCLAKNGMPEISGSSQRSELTPTKMLKFVKEFQKDYNCPSDRIVAYGENITMGHVAGMSAGLTYLGVGFFCGLTMGVACLGLPVIMGGMQLADNEYQSQKNQSYQRNGQPMEKVCHDASLENTHLDSISQAEWYQVCLELSTITNAYSEYTLKKTTEVTPGFEHPVKLNDRFLKWRNNNGDEITDLSPLLLLRDQMRSNKKEERTLCLSDHETSDTITSNLNLTLRNAVDIITDQILRYR